MLGDRLGAIRRWIVALWGLGLAATWLAWTLHPSQMPIRLGLFVATLAVQAAALLAALLGRRALGPADPSRRALTAIALGLGLRLLAELRLLTFYVEAVPAFVRADALLNTLYVDVLRYLYAAADLAFFAAFVSTLRGLTSTGLEFRMRPRDGVVVALLVPLPFAVHALHAALAPVPVDAPILTFRLVGAAVGAAVTGVCVALASAALQMGGGAWPWIWGAAALAGIARSLAFVAAAAATASPAGLLVEQGLLWTFACGWLLATGLHLRLVRGAP